MSGWQTVIIGAGPAGSVAGALLARAGIRTLIVEQHAFPRDKVCGECLSAVGIDVLSRRGIIDVVERLRPVPLRRALLHAPDGTCAELPLPRPMWGVSRRALDQALLNAAKVAGATVWQPARCEAAEPGLIVRDLATNDLRRLGAPVVLVADGRAALSGDKPAPSGDLGIKAHFLNVNGPRDAIELFGVAGHYGGLAAVEDGTWNASCSIPQDRVRESQGDLDALFGRIVSENRTLARRMRGAHRCGDWYASPLPRFPVRRCWARGVVPVGNAAAALEPIGGEGMGLAMRSAELAATEVGRAIRSGTPVDVAQLRAEYRRLWRVRSLVCRAGAVLISSPRVAPAALELINTSDSLRRLALDLLGKRLATS